MAGKDLDALAEGLARGRISRGQALKRMGVALLGGLLASAPMTAAFADACPENRQKCGGRCCPKGWVCRQVGETGPRVCRPRGQA